MNIRDEESKRLIAQMAAEAGESKAATVREALRAERVRRVDLRRNRREELRRLLGSGA